MNNTLLIIPAYNEAENIERVVDNLIENYPQYDYVVINDGSRDDTRKILHNRGYNYLDLPVNTGLAGAFRCGVRYANAVGYDYVVQFDGDGQHRAESIAPMLEKMQSSDSDIVIGSRFCEKKKDHSARMLGSRLITSAIRLKTGKIIKDPTSGLRMYNKRMIKLVGYDMAYTPEPDTLAYMIRCGAKVDEVQVEMDERMFGTSYLNIWNSVRYMITVVFNTLFLQWVRKKEEL
ncbi:MAG: glycosyltransferase family 2 protein [Lachnospiraceae bacterium]|nr:glycosyltransferase family 2 protein [Lachnospiraceae bacterium]